MQGSELPPARPGWSRVPAVAYHVLLAVLVLTYGILLVWRPVLGRYDFWAHAAIGRWVCENGRAPDRSLFLWSADEPWVYHSWLSQVTFYGLTRVGGPESLPTVVLAFTALVALVPFALAWGMWAVRARPTCLMAIPFALALEVAAPRLQTRPELFTAAFLTALLAWLATRRTEPAARLPRVQIAVALVLFVLWANFHGAVVLGVLVLALTAACDFIQNRRDGCWKAPAALAVLAPVAVCANPYGPEYWTALIPVGSDRFAEILEWQSPLRIPTLPLETLVVACLLPALALFAWALNRERRLAQLAWLALFTVMFVLARRNIWPLTLASLVVLAANARSLDAAPLCARLLRRKSVTILPVLRWALRAFVLAWLFLQIWPVYALQRPWRHFVPTRLEEGIVRFIRDEQLRGRVFNDYENSSYLQWSFAGEPALAIDLLNAYPDRVVHDYRDLVTASERGRGLLDEQNIGIVILTTNRGAGANATRLADYLDSRSEWVRVYAKRDGVIWVRRTAEYERVWKKHEAGTPRTAFVVLDRWGDEASEMVPAVSGP